MPIFGADDSNRFQYYIAKNIISPVNAVEQRIQGCVYVKFIVETDGCLSNIKVVKSDDSFLDEEAIRVVKSSPKWEPGKQNGVPVRVTLTYPSIFYIER